METWDPKTKDLANQLISMVGLAAGFCDGLKMGFQKFNNSVLQNDLDRNSNDILSFSQDYGRNFNLI